MATAETKGRRESRLETLQPYQCLYHTTMADASDKSTSGGDLLESAFAHIQAGNDAKDCDDLWEAAKQWEAASRRLGDLSAKTEGDSNNDKEAEEVAKISSLYRSQSRDYFDRARAVLVAAMQQEHEKDTSNTGNEDKPVKMEGDHHEDGDALKDEDDYHYYCRSLSDAELDERMNLFSRLFAKGKRVAEGGASTANQEAEPTNDNDNFKNQQSSLEERLMHLNDNLPHGFKTSDQRMRDINRGLNRLGFSLYSAADEAKRVEVLPTKSESEQVSDIIAQAKDEVAMGIVGPTNTSNNADGANVTAHVDDILLDDSFDSEDDDGGSTGDSAARELTEDQINRIREFAVDAQAQLAQLLALLAVDGGGDAEIEFEPAVVLRHLTTARKSLAKASREWNQDDE